MKLLLDTHIFIWLIEGNPNLTQTARQAIEDEKTSQKPGFFPKYW